VRRHYKTIDVVIGTDGNVTSGLCRDAGMTTEPGLIVYRFGGGVFYANATRLSTRFWTRQHP